MNKSLAFILLLAFSFLPAFAGGNQEGPSDERMEISFAFWDSSGMPAERDEYLDKYEEMHGISIKYIPVTWGDYTQKFSLWASTGELPDMFTDDSLYADRYNQWAEEGIIRSIPQEMIDRYPNVKAVYDNPKVEKYISINDEYFTIPKLNYTSEAYDMHGGIVIWLRTDWLKALNLEMPTNYEELKVVLKAFVEKDPDGNGQNDTIGLIPNDLRDVESWIYGNNRDWVKEDGMWMPKTLSRSIEPLMDQIGEMRDEGLLSPDFLVIKDPAGREAFAQGRAGALLMGTSIWHWNTLHGLWSQYNDDLLDTHIAPLPAFPFAEEQGDFYYSRSPLPFWSSNLIRGDVSDEKLEKILAITDWAWSKEGSVMLKWGLEGVNYTMNGEEVEFVSKPEYPSRGFLGHFTSGNGTYAPDLFDVNHPSKPFDPAYVNAANAFVKARTAMGFKPAPTNIGTQSFYSEAKQKITDIMAESQISTYMLEADPAASWFAKVDEWMNSGLREALETYNKELTAAGLDKYDIAP